MGPARAQKRARAAAGWSADGAAGGDEPGADELHGQAAGGECGVDRSRELYGDGDGDGWATVALGDVQLDGAVK